MIKFVIVGLVVAVVIAVVIVVCRVVKECRELDFSDINMTL